jgi:hypothetical protein
MLNPSAKISVDHNKSSHKDRLPTPEVENLTTSAIKEDHFVSSTIHLFHQDVSKASPGAADTLPGKRHERNCYLKSLCPFSVDHDKYDDRLWPSALTYDAWLHNH